MSYTLFHTHRKANRYYQMIEHPSYVTTKPLSSGRDALINSWTQPGGKFGPQSTETCFNTVDALPKTQVTENTLLRYEDKLKSIPPDSQECQKLLNQLNLYFGFTPNATDASNTACANVRSNGGTVIIGNQVCSTGPSSPAQGRGKRR